jgi:hypothetical protein
VDTGRNTTPSYIKAEKCCIIIMLYGVKGDSYVSGFYYEKDEREDMEERTNGKGELRQLPR